MKVFITGATGFIGRNLAEKLAGENHNVTVMVRDQVLGKEFEKAGFSVVYGSLSDKAVLKSGMTGCDWVFHLAAYTRPASKDKQLPYTINVEGTVNVLEAASERSLGKVIITSTAGTLGCSVDGERIDETTRHIQEYHTYYEKTKALAEETAFKYNSSSMEVVVVNPTRVFGPGKMSLSNSVTRIISMYGKGLWRILPGNGSAIANYVFIDDVVNGHLLAAMYGKGGERYILGGENLSYCDFFDILGSVYNKKRRLIALNESFLKGIVKMAGLWSRVSGSPAFITDAWVDKYLQTSAISSEKAVALLGYRITPFREGAEKTVQWLKS
ncbi:MAG TPA: NAD-dependent epimerase/dehydratase family protein [Bacteroidales bacterium]|nr:NAD-dependent epimerase/dehydratase family protein [Bacteroidales bacterium]